MSSTPINNTQYLYVKRNGYANYSGATAQNSSVFGTSPIKQTTNEDSFVAFESNEKANNSNSETAQLRQSLNETKSKQGFIGKLWDGFKNLTGIGAGSSKAEKAITDYENGKISKEEMEKAVNGYTEGQKMVVDVVADMASGILAIGAFALAVPTGGASLAVGLGLATAVGAGSKVLIKGGDALLTGKEYSGKDLLYDTVTGGINGVLAPVTNGIGNTVTKTIGTKLGLTIVKEGAEEVVEQGVKQGVKQGLKSIVLNQTTDVVGGTVAKRAVALGAGMAVDGALGGAADNMVRAGLNGENVLEAGVQGAVGGLIMAPVVGGGFRVAGKAGKALGNKINTGKTLSSEVATSKIMPDTTPAIIQGGVAPDEKKMMRISLQFFGGKAADNATDATRVINGEAAKAIDLPNGVRSAGGEVQFKGINSEEFWESNPDYDYWRYGIYENIGAWELVDETSGISARKINASDLSEIDFKYGPLEELGIQNFTLATNNRGVRGSSIFAKNNKRFMQDLRKNGIIQVIDLRTESNIARSVQQCSDNGLEYTSFPIIYDKKLSVEEIQSTRAKMPQFIEAMNKGRYYIGCSEGTNRTDVAFAINYLFNPKETVIPMFESQKPQKSLQMTMMVVNGVLERDSSKQYHVPESLIRELGWESKEAFLEEFEKRLKRLNTANIY